MKKGEHILLSLFVSSLLLVFGASQIGVDLAMDKIIQSVYDGSLISFNHENGVNVSHLFVV